MGRSSSPTSNQVTSASPGAADRGSHRRFGGQQRAPAATGAARCPAVQANDLCTRGHLLRELTERVRTGGLKLTGEGGLLGKLTKMVVEGALEGELDDHLG